MTGLPAANVPTAAGTVSAPRVWAKDRDWFDQSRVWHLRKPADLHGVVDPGVVQAASGHTFVVSLTCGPTLTLQPGAHLTLEIPESWDTHLANCYRRGIHTVGARNQIKVGYGAFVDVACSNPAVVLDVAVSWGRLFDLVDVVVSGAAVHPGDAIRIILGPPDGNLVECQKYAQVAILTTGVDPTGDGIYAPAATQPTVKVVGATAARFRVFAPGIVPRGEPFPVRVLPVDLYCFNPSPGYAGQIETFANPGLSLPASVDVRTDETAQPTSLTAVADVSGTYRITVFDPGRGLAGRSNPVATDFFPRDPAARIYFGELHSQMWHSMGTGTTAEFFSWGRDAAGLDFCAPANHYNHRSAVTPEVWQEVQDTANRFDQPGRFATLVSYEWGGVAGSGHKNVYYRGNRGEFAHWYDGVHRSPEDLWDSLAGRDVLTIPHHTKFGSPTDWSHRNDRHQRLVEICSLWGISESGGPHSVQAALALGHRLGFVGGTDSHYGLANQGSYHVDDGNGLACVVAPQLTRDAIWQALFDRRCYATTGERILLDFSLDRHPGTAPNSNSDPTGYPMGTDLPVDLGACGPRTFTIRVAGTQALEQVEILRNNQVVFAIPFPAGGPAVEDWDGQWIDADLLPPLAVAPTFPDDRPFVFYYLRVRQRNRQMAWSSPIWLTQRADKAGQQDEPQSQKGAPHP